MLALSPLGGSFVSFMPDCNIGTGNLVEGAEVSQSLYSG